MGKKISHICCWDKMSGSACGKKEEVNRSGTVHGQETEWRNILENHPWRKLPYGWTHWKLDGSKYTSKIQHICQLEQYERSERWHTLKGPPNIWANPYTISVYLRITNIVLVACAQLKKLSWNHSKPHLNGASTPPCANLAHSHTRFVMLFDWKV